MRVPSQIVFVILCGVLATANVAPVQAGIKYPVIKPGKGIGLLSLGDSSQRVKRKIGYNPVKRTYQQEKAIFEKFGRAYRKGNTYNTQAELLFFIGFDFIYEYRATSNRSMYPVWKLYFKDDKLVYMVMSSFVYPKIPNFKSRGGQDDVGRLLGNASADSISKIGVPPTCYFLGTYKDMKNTLGTPELVQRTIYGNRYNFFFKQGIKIIFTTGNKRGSKELIRTIAVFKPFDDAQKDAFMRNLQDSTR